MWLFGSLWMEVKSNSDFLYVASFLFRVVGGMYSGQINCNILGIGFGRQWDLYMGSNRPYSEAKEVASTRQNHTHPILLSEKLES
jgi:hypothetical protein